MKSPIPGRYDWVFDLDLTSMYPSIIMSLNMSPETKIGKINGWDAEEFIRGEEKHYSVEKDGKTLRGKDACKALNSSQDLAITVDA